MNKWDFTALIVLLVGIMLALGFGIWLVSDAKAAPAVKLPSHQSLGTPYRVQPSLSTTTSTYPGPYSSSFIVQPNPPDIGATLTLADQVALELRDSHGRLMAYYWCGIEVPDTTFFQRIGKWYWSGKPAMSCK